jgi:hypothetical protein
MSGPDVRPPAPHGASPDGPVGGAEGAFDFLPRNFDWRGKGLDTIRKYPIPCLLGAAAVGFWIGRHRGAAIGAAAAGVASNLVLRELNRVLSGDDVI